MTISGFSIKCFASFHKIDESIVRPFDHVGLHYISITKMANSHGLKSSIVKKQAAARKLSKGKKKMALVYTGNENKQSRFNLSYKKRTRYMQNKDAFPKKKLPTKNIDQLVELGILDER